MKYSGENRWVFLRALCAPNGGSPEVQITVEDKGIGISAADLAHIFDPFYRAEGVRDGQVRGVGLGLYLVKRMMEAMGGSVSVSSKPSKGSVFTLHFPVFDSTEAHNMSAKPRQPKLRTSRRRIIPNECKNTHRGRRNRISHHSEGSFTEGRVCRRRGSGWQFGYGYGHA